MGGSCKGLRCAAAVGLVVGLTACGGGGGGGDAGAPGANSPAESYFPLAAGDRWIYEARTLRVAGTRTVRGETATVLALGDVDDSLIEETLYVRDAGGVRQVPADDADALTRAIGSLQLMRFPLVQGDSFTQLDKTLDLGADFDGDGRSESVVARSVVTVQGFERVSVPAGSFDGSAHLRTVLTQTYVFSGNGARETVTTTIDEWFAPGVGSVQVEVATRYAGQTDRQVQKLDGYGVGGRRSETLAPAVTERSPADGGAGNAGTVLRASISEPLDLETVGAGALTVTDSTGQPVPGLVSLQPRTNRQAPQLIFQPFAAWPSGTYTAQLGSGITDRVGNPLAATTPWTFTIDGAGPAVRSMTPEDGSVDVGLRPTITLVFSEPIDPASLAPERVALQSSATGRVPSDIRLEGDTITITPQQDVALGMRHVVYVSDLRDLAGNPMTSTYGGSFLTTAGRFAMPQTILDVASPVESVAVGDLDGDGRADVVLATGYYFEPESDYKLFVRHGRADGTLGPPVRYDTGNVYPGRSTLSVVDVNGDGRLDVVMGQGDAGIEIFLQTPAGTLASASRLPGATHRAVTADIDLDGRVDVVSLAWGVGTVQVWRQQPGGGFTAPVDFAVEHFGWENLAVGDVNGDGRPDIVITSGQGDRSKALAVLRQRADGGFGPAEYRAVDPVWGSWGVAIGDVNGDGRNDIVASGMGNSPTFIGVFRQAADGSLLAMETLGTYDIPRAVGIADFDRDGRNDVIVTHEGWVALSYYGQQSDGSLASEIRLPLPYIRVDQPALAIADLNGDGWLDVVLGASLALQKAPPTQPLAVSGRLRTLITKPPILPR